MPRNLVTSGRKEIDLEQLFVRTTPPSVNSLLYNLDKYSDNQSPSQLATIKILYDVFSSEVEYEQRTAIFQYVIQMIQESTTDPSVIQVFIRFETNPFLVRDAVTSYLQLKFAPWEDPFTATQDIISLLTSPGVVVNRGAAYAGLVCFGDRRVCSVARTIRHSMTASETRAFAAVVSAPLHRASIEFCLTWLNDLVIRKKFDLAIPVASTLSAMAIVDSGNAVHDHEYNFGPYGFSTSTVAPLIKYEDLLVEILPILDSIAQVNQPALNQMIDIIRDPKSSTMDQLERRKNSTRRNHMERRASDRRIVEIRPRSERRALQRRGDERREVARR